jgi:hypothetical protein
MAEEHTRSAGGRWLRHGQLAIAGLTLVLVAVDIGLVLVNQSRQAVVNQRQQFINQSTQLARVNEGLVRALATAAYRTKDETLHKLLADQGINYTFTPSAAPPPAAAAPATPAVPAAPSAPAAGKAP